MVCGNVGDGPLLEEVVLVLVVEVLGFVVVELVEGLGVVDVADNALVDLHGSVRVASVKVARVVVDVSQSTSVFSIGVPTISHA